MKIVHISDIHNDREMARKAVEHASKIEADAIVFSGDIADYTLNYEQSCKMYGAYQFLSEIKSDRPISFSQLVEIVLENEKVHSELKLAARDFREMETEFDKRTKEQYARISEVFEKFSKPIMIVPGNWDSANFNEFFSQCSVHKNGRDIDGLSFAGYGGSPEMPVMSGDKGSVPGIPVTRIVNYDEDEMYAFLSNADPDVAVTHNHQRVNFRNSGGVRHAGSFALTAYLRGECPKMVLCGHSHIPYLVEDGKTWIVNPGNLGKYEKQDYGTFAEIELTGSNGGKIPRKISLNKFEGSGIKTMEERVIEYTD